MSELAAVWPLVEGLNGVNHLTSKKCKLYPFQKGFMDLDEAKKLQDDGKLQLMAGLDLQSLKQEGDNAHLKVVLKPKAKPVPKRKPKSKSEYKTKVMTPDTGSDDKFLD